ncbi:thiamine phosphate synthase [Gracilibacillus lacisalsi]|uniref:thiamine phosphate synthase n=1 Tax=Gracilibacillus lacisalsi TaxID=393087 RepID=UPI000365A04D|nr:thiamine phosphate synthase [Gracilibacillus lacisalsi]
MMKRDLLQVYFILGSNNMEQDPLYVLEEALKGGITLFQFREKGYGALTGQDKKQLAIEMKKLCHQYDIPFLVNDDVDLALEIEADGVHVGQEDMSIQEVRKIVPSDWLVGVSSTNVQEAVQAKNDGADYIGVGPIFSTNTKNDAKKPIGAEGLREIRDNVGDLPIVAIGGIQLGHVIELMRAGADGVSVISAISQSPNPESATATFYKHTNYYSKEQ